MTKKTKSKILITGSAGFIGFHLVCKLALEGYEIIGFDNINDYYDVRLKYARLKETGITKSKITNNQQLITSSKYPNYKFIKIDLLDKAGLNKLFLKQKFDYVIHLAAQAGVRYSLKNPQAYIDSNITGFFNLLETCKEIPPKHLIFASSSSVYGSNTKIPFCVTDNSDHPVSLYAATKKSNEVMAYAYSSLYGIPATGLRFFTVYGPFGRPDMAYYSFSEKIIQGKRINVFNSGNMKRDFTFIDDVTESIKRLINHPPKVSNINQKYLYNIFNIGNSKPVELNYFISLLEKYLKKEAKKSDKPMQKGDMIITYSDTTELKKYINFEPKVNIEDGLKIFCDWLLNFNN